MEVGSNGGLKESRTTPVRHDHACDLDGQILIEGHAITLDGKQWSEQCPCVSVCACECFAVCVVGFVSVCVRSSVSLFVSLGL